MAQSTKTVSPLRQRMIDDMTLSTNEFIRRFLIHVLPKGFHRIRHYGLLANPVRRDNLTQLRQAMNAPNALCEPDIETPATSASIGWS